MDELKNNQIQARVPLYTKWVILSLIGTHGTNVSDVVSWILRDWINKHDAWLTNMGLSVNDYKNWRRERESPKPVQAKVLDIADASKSSTRRVSGLGRTTRDEIS